MAVSMGKNENNENVVNQPTKEMENREDELYLYSLRKMAETNVAENVIGLTKLNNLKAFFYLGGQLFREHPENKYAVIVMDIDRFKAVNEFCGRTVGDNLLKCIADSFRWYEHNREYTIACHVRADIFALCTAYEDDQELVDIVKNIEEAVDSFEMSYNVLPSFGICLALESKPDISYLKDCATIALNTIKGKFYSTYTFFDEKMRQKQMLEKQIESEVIHSIEQKDFTIFIQPKVDMRTKRIVGGEALVRWMHPIKGKISPVDFIPVLEKNGFIINMDVYVWDLTFRFVRELLDKGIQPVPISVNVSRLHAYDADFYNVFLNLAEKYNISTEYIKIELTESAFLLDEDRMYKRLIKLREKGFEISMDDFGTGYSTMIMLKDQAVDEIKVDRGFITDISNPKARIIVKYIMKMLNELDLNIIMEGVEDEEQMNFLLECGCNKAQGFYFYKPMRMEQFEQLIIEQNI